MRQKTLSRAYNRDISKRKALRKRRLSEEIYHDGKKYPFFNNLHQYSKNKIHCSCVWCQQKTKRNKHKPDWGSSRYNWKHSDKKKIDSMDWAD